MDERLYFQALQALPGTKAQGSRLAFYLSQLRNTPPRTLRQVAEESKAYKETISVSMLADAEKGNVIPSAAKLITLAKIYRIPPQRFLDLIELDSVEAEPRENESLDELEARAKQLFDLGDYAQAHAIYEKAITFSADVDRRAQLRNRKAVCLWKMGKTHWARDEFEAVLGHYALPVDIKFSAWANLSAVFRQVRNYEMSRATALQALALAETLKDNDRRGIVHNTLGNLDMDLWEEQKRTGAPLLARATEHYLEALACFGENTATAQTHALVAMLNLGECYVFQGAAQKGFRHLKKAFKLSEDIGNQRYIALALNVLGKCYYELKDYETAGGYLHKSDAASLQHGYLDLRFSSNFYLWKIARAGTDDVAERRARKTLDYLVKHIEADGLEVMEFLRLTQNEGKTQGEEGGHE